MSRTKLHDVTAKENTITEPKWYFCVMITFKLNIVTTKITKPITSNFLASAFIPLIGSALVSGACLIKYIANNVNRIETTNI